MSSLFAISMIACVISLLLTPIMRRMAPRFDLIDKPDNHRKLHVNSTPLGGGVAVLVALLVTIVGLLFVESPWRAQLREHIWFAVSLGCSLLIITFVGLLDDRYHLRGRQKLLGQFVAVLVVTLAGLQIDELQILHWRVPLGVAAVPFTVFWMLGAINALNLLDGIDGLATGVGIIFSVAVGVAGLMNHHDADAVMAFVLAGALIGFLVYNAPPASIFLGDAGSMLIGLMLGALAIRCSLKGPATFAMSVPTAIWAIPIFDVSMAIVRRKLTGRSIYSTDRGHLHHNLLRRGLSDRRVVALISVLCICTATGALISIYNNDERLALGSMAVVFCSLVVTRMFGDAECRLLLNRTSSLLASFVQLRKSTRPEPQVTRLQGSHEWDSLWKTLTVFAQRFDLHSVQLNVNVPSIHEEYHASWRRKSPPRSTEHWETEIPLVAHGFAVGRLRISGACIDGSICSWMGDIIAGLKPFETDMLELLENAFRANSELDNSESEVPVVA